jgi:mannitol-1-/sugar-/sorbitol-6-phosphatase
MSHTFDAFIFDLDDTLVDSSAIIHRVMRSWCQEHRIETDKVLRLSRGLRTEDTIAKVAPHLDAKSEARRIEHLEQRASGEVKPIRGAKDFLLRTPRDKWAIATSSSLSSAQHKLSAAGLPVPDVLIASEMVQNGKPDPEAFRLAAARLDSDPSRCLVFEDADSGIEAAEAAGCKVVVIGSDAVAEVSGIIGRVDDFTQVSLRLDNDGLAVSLPPNSG